MLTANAPARLIALPVREVRFRQTISIGGSRHSDEMALAVEPWSTPSERTVTTVTPLAKRPMTSRNSSASTKAGPGSSMLALPSRRLPQPRGPDLRAPPDHTTIILEALGDRMPTVTWLLR